MFFCVQTFCEGGAQAYLYQLAAPLCPFGPLSPASSGMHWFPMGLTASLCP